jgi:hypothetical protein
MATNVSEESASIHLYNLKMQISGSSETLVTTYKTICCHNSEDHNLRDILPIITFLSPIQRLEDNIFHHSSSSRIEN